MIEFFLFVYFLFIFLFYCSMKVCHFLREDKCEVLWNTSSIIRIYQCCLIQEQKPSPLCCLFFDMHLKSRFSLNVLSRPNKIHSQMGGTDKNSRMKGRRSIEIFIGSAHLAVNNFHI